MPKANRRVFNLRLSEFCKLLTYQNLYKVELRLRAGNPDGLDGAGYNTVAP